LIVTFPHSDVYIIAGRCPTVKARRIVRVTS
jgi:hypothetical protein